MVIYNYLFSVALCFVLGGIVIAFKVVQVLIKRKIYKGHFIIDIEQIIFILKVTGGFAVFFVLYYAADDIWADVRASALSLVIIVVTLIIWAIWSICVYTELKKLRKEIKRYRNTPND